MAERIHGAATATQSLSADLSYYVCYASSPNCFTLPHPNPPVDQELTRLVNIQVTGSPTDQSQKNFEVLLMSIGLRAMPSILTNPTPVLELSDYTVELSGQGFMWKFAVERGSMFSNFTPVGTPGPVGLLIDELDGVILPSGVRITTVSSMVSGWAKNIAFSKMESI